MEIVPVVPNRLPFKIVFRDLLCHELTVGRPSIAVVSFLDHIQKTGPRLFKLLVRAMIPPIILDGEFEKFDPFTLPCNSTCGHFAIGGGRLRGSVFGVPGRFKKVNYDPLAVRHDLIGRFKLVEGTGKVFVQAFGVAECHTREIVVGADLKCLLRVGRRSCFVAAGKLDERTDRKSCRVRWIHTQCGLSIVRETRKHRYVAGNVEQKLGICPVRIDRQSIVYRKSLVEIEKRQFVSAEFIEQPPAYRTGSRILRIDLDRT